MKIHTSVCGRKECHEIAVGTSLCGVGISRVELSAGDVLHPNLFEYLNNVIFTRLVPDEVEDKTATLSNLSSELSNLSSPVNDAGVKSIYELRPRNDVITWVNIAGHVESKTVRDISPHLCGYTDKDDLKWRVFVFFKNDPHKNYAMRPKRLLRLLLKGDVRMIRNGLDMCPLAL